VRYQWPLPLLSRLPRRHFELTAHVGLVAVFGTCLLGLLTADWAGWDELADAVFFMASSLGVYYVRPGNLLPMVVSPPLLFGVACAASSLLTSSGALTGLGRMAVTLAGAAWWMIAGMALTLAIAWLRGLRSEVAGLIHELRQGYE